MTKFNSTREELLEDLLIGQLEMLRVRLVEDITDIDKYIERIKRQFNAKTKAGDRG